MSVVDDVRVAGSISGRDKNIHIQQKFNYSGRWFLGEQLHMECQLVSLSS